MAKSRKRKHSPVWWRFGVIIVVLLILGSLAWGGYVLWRNLRRTTVHINRTEFPIAGIDVSMHNGDIDFDKVAADSIQFVYIKATEGVTYVDPQFYANYFKSRQAGLAVGVYHFFRFEKNGTLQAENLLNTIKGMSFDLPIVIDVERHGSLASLTVAEESIPLRLRDMVNALEKNGFTPIIYCNMDGYKDFYLNGFEDCRLWICTFRKPVAAVKWTFWQYSQWGKVDGIDGDVDLDVFVGSRKQFEKLTRRNAIN